MATTTTTSTTASTTPTTTPGMRAALALPTSSTGVGITDEVTIATLVVSTWVVEVELAAGEESETPEGRFGELPELVITVLVVSIGGDVLVVGLVVGRI